MIAAQWDQTKFEEFRQVTDSGALTPAEAVRARPVNGTLRKKLSDDTSKRERPNAYEQ